jgi:hypothetical protein
MSVVSGPLGDVRDGRQSPAAFAICRGVARLLKAYGLAAVSEVALANGRRADVAGIADSGEIWIVEIKSSVEDLRAARNGGITGRIATGCSSPSPAICPARFSPNRPA